MDRTMSTLPVLQTPVTRAPNAFAIWTANVPTSRRAVDEELVAGLNPPFLPECLQCSQPRPNAEEIRRPSHEMRVERVDRRGPDFEQDLTVHRRQRCTVVAPEHIG